MTASGERFLNEIATDVLSHKDKKFAELMHRGGWVDTREYMDVSEAELPKQGKVPIMDEKDDVVGQMHFTLKFEVSEASPGGYSAAGCLHEGERWIEADILEVRAEWHDKPAQGTPQPREPSREEIDKATDELAEVLADFDLSDEELINVRDTIRERVKRAQRLLLYGEED